VNGDGLDDLIVGAPLITKPSVLVPAAMADNSMALVLPCLPNTTYDLLELSAIAAGTGGLTSPALETE
jgi:hypothetical protein